MPINTLRNQTIALAGISQACALVQQLATTGNADTDAFSASIASVLKLDADSVFDVFGGLVGVSFGLQQLDRQLSSRVTASPEQARYAAQLVHLQKQLANKPEMLRTINAGVTKAQTQAEHFGLLHENVLANLADIYHSTISTLQPRIMVVGDQNHLSNPITVNKIRALLLAGIRSSLLWRQCGGSRWRLVLTRNKVRTEAAYLLSQL